jgi:hypothetical protein
MHLNSLLKLTPSKISWQIRLPRLRLHDSLNVNFFPYNKDTETASVFVLLTVLLQLPLPMVPCADTKTLTNSEPPLPHLYRHRDGLGFDTTDTDKSNEKASIVKSVTQQKVEHTWLIRRSWRIHLRRGGRWTASSRPSIASLQCCRSRRGFGRWTWLTEIRQQKWRKIQKWVRLGELIKYSESR